MELVHRLGADGVHLGKNDMPPREARALLGPQKIIGATANTFGDIRRAAAQGADYIGLGPFRFTRTKEKLSPILGIEGYREILARCAEQGIRLPVVAIGGITAADVDALMATGIAGIALSGALLNAENPAEETKKNHGISSKNTNHERFDHRRTDLPFRAFSSERASSVRTTSWPVPLQPREPRWLPWR